MRPKFVPVRETERLDETGTVVDNVVGVIAWSRELRLLEVKSSQWRAGAWRDPETGVHWLLVAGLALGDHEDREDFYQRVERRDDAGRTSDWLPTEADTRLLKQETSARLMTEWEVLVQRKVRDALSEVHAGGSTRVVIPHPMPGQDPIATLNLVVSPVREEGYEADEIEAEILAGRKYRGSNLEWQLRIRVLITLSPPEQGWDCWT